VPSKPFVCLFMHLFSLAALSIYFNTSSKLPLEPVLFLFFEGGVNKVIFYKLFIRIFVIWGD
jgi:hypothetical protein